MQLAATTTGGSACVCAFVRACVCVFTQWAAARGYSFSNNRQREEGGWGGVGMEEVFGEGKKKKPRSPARAEVG